MKNPVVKIKQAKDKKFYYAVVASNNLTLAHSEMYASKQGAIKGANALFNNLQYAGIEDVDGTPIKPSKFYVRKMEGDFQRAMDEVINSHKAAEKYSIKKLGSFSEKVSDLTLANYLLSAFLAASVVLNVMLMAKLLGIV